MVNIYNIFFLDMHVQSAQDEGKQFIPSVMSLYCTLQQSSFGLLHQKTMRMGEPHEGCQGVIFDLKFNILD